MNFITQFIALWLKNKILLNLENALIKTRTYSYIHVCIFVTYGSLFVCFPEWWYFWGNWRQPNWTNLEESECKPLHGSFWSPPSWQHDSWRPFSMSLASPNGLVEHKILVALPVEKLLSSKPQLPYSLEYIYDILALQKRYCRVSEQGENKLLYLCPSISSILFACSWNLFPIHII